MTSADPLVPLVAVAKSCLNGTRTVRETVAYSGGFWHKCCYVELELDTPLMSNIGHRYSTVTIASLVRIDGKGETDGWVVLQGGDYTFLGVRSTTADSQRYWIRKAFSQAGVVA